MNNLESYSFNIDSLKELSNEFGRIADDCDVCFNSIRNLIRPLLKDEEMDSYYKSIISGYYSDLAIYVMFYTNSVRNLGDLLKSVIDSYSSIRDGFVSDLDNFLKKLKSIEK